MFAQLIEDQKKMIKSGKTRPLAYRQGQLKKLEKLIKRYSPKIAQALMDDFKKPELDSYSSEIGFVVNEIQDTLKHLSSWAGEKRFRPPVVLLPGRSRLISEPRGSVLVLAPWNYPFNLALAPVVAAMAAGNAIILKPSELAPHTQKVIADMINENFEREEFFVCTGDVNESIELTHQNFDFIFFTGSTSVGKQVMKAASENLVPVCLELGGKSPCIVDKNTNLEVTARRIVWGKYFNGGQTCVAPDYLYVDQSIVSDLKKAMVIEVKNFFGENPKQSKDYPRIINDRHFDRLVALIQQEKTICGGDFDKSELYIAPSIMQDVSWDDPVMQEEIFGPILPILTFEDIDTVVDHLATQPKPLALYVFTHDESFKEKVLEKVSFGGGCVNDCLVHLADPNLPFGGVGASGMGAYHGKYGFDLFSHQKSVVDRSFMFDLSLRYPPYDERKTKWLKKLL